MSKKYSFDEIAAVVKAERDKQDEKWGPTKFQNAAGYLLILEAELNEAKEGWMKNVEGKHSSLAEIVQIAAVAFACLEQHGISGYPL